MSYIGGPLPGQEGKEIDWNEERLLGSRVSEQVYKAMAALPKDKPWLNKVGKGLEWVADNSWHEGWIKAEEALIEKVGEYAPKIGIDSLVAQMGVGILIPGPGEARTAKRVVKTGHLMQDAVKAKTLTKTKFLSDPLYDVSTTKVNRTAGGYEGLGHQGLANIMYQDNPGLKLKFGKLRSFQQQSPFKHHHIEDIAFTGQWANTSDFEEVFKELNKIKIYPGDSPTNIIGMMDEGNLFLQTGKTDLLRELKRTNFPGLENINRYSDLMRKDAPKGVKRLIDDVFKSPEYGDEFFKGSIDKLGRKTPNQMQNMFETLPDGTRVPTVLPQKDIGFETWKALGLDAASENFRKLPIEQQQLLKSQTWSNRFKTLGVNRKNIKYDPTKMILSKDHIDTIHYKVYDSPKFTQKRELLKMIEDGSYHKLTAKQKAEKIAEVYKVQKNTSINVAKTRLKLIKNYLKEAEPIRYRDIYSKDPTKLRQWIIDNPGISANLGWKEGIPDYKTLTNSKTAEIITDEFRTVFSTLVR